jgi:hypothetical protein
VAALGLIASGKPTPCLPASSANSYLQPTYSEALSKQAHGQNHFNFFFHKNNIHYYNIYNYIIICLLVQQNMEMILVILVAIKADILDLSSNRVKRVPKMGIWP